MICPGCLNEKNLAEGSYCAACRRALFDGRAVPAVLPFDRTQYVSFRVASAGRFSISGVQPKVTLRQNGTLLEPVEIGGTHILKPAPHSDNIPCRADEVPANEHLTMQIARQVFRLPVAQNGFIRFKSGEPAYITRRFDRLSDGAKIPQEDLCQLLGISEEINGRDYKYKFSYERAARVIGQFCAAKRVETEKYFRLVLFNYAFSNGDAHLKNFSLHRSPDGDHLLTPAYDLLCSSLHFPDEHRTALDLFDEFETPQFRDNGFYTGACFRAFADRLDIRASLAERSVALFFEREPAVAALVERSFLSDGTRREYLARYRDRLKALSIR